MVFEDGEVDVGIDEVGEDAGDEGGGVAVGVEAWAVTDAVGIGTETAAAFARNVEGEVGAFEFAGGAVPDYEVVFVVAGIDEEVAEGGGEGGWGGVAGSDEGIGFHADGCAGEEGSERTVGGLVRQVRQGDFEKATIDLRAGTAFQRIRYKLDHNDAAHILIIYTQVEKTNAFRRMG